MCVRECEVLGGGGWVASCGPGLTDTDEKEEARLSGEEQSKEETASTEALRRCVPGVPQGMARGPWRALGMARAVKLPWDRSQRGQQEGDSSRGIRGHIMSDLPCKAFCPLNERESLLESV